MTDTQTMPVNPLTGDLTTITVQSPRAKGGAEDVQGVVIGPGLAITPSVRNEKRTTKRYALTHIASGYIAAPWTYCGSHVQTVAKLAVASGVDWTVPDRAEVVETAKRSGYLERLAEVGQCREKYCDGDGPEPPSWMVRCETCGWDWEDEFDEGPLDAQEAKDMADSHECEPVISIRDPATGRWHNPSLVNDDGTIRGATQ